jgi:hypothetical protein|tara:strand:+ start:288 stop:683 length:396 start_codon:yes stop_codon:yes gene_type:complete
MFDNLEKLKIAIETEEEIKRNPEYKKFTQLLNECSKVKSQYAKETKDIIKPFVKYTNAGILIPESHTDKIFQRYGMELVKDNTGKSKRYSVHNPIGNSENVVFSLGKRTPQKITLDARGFKIYHDSEKDLF